MADFCEGEAVGRKQAYAAPPGKKWCPAHDNGRGGYRPTSEFGHNCTRADGLQGYCRECWKLYQQAHYRHNSQDAAWRKATNERVRRRAVRKSQRVCRRYDPHKTYPCSKCKRVLAADQFQQRVNKSGMSLHSQCNACCRESNTEWKRKNSQRVNEQRRLDGVARKILDQMERAV